MKEGIYEEKEKIIMIFCLVVSASLNLDSWE